MLFLLFYYLQWSFVDLENQGNRASSYISLGAPKIGNNSFIFNVNILSWEINLRTSYQKLLLMIVYAFKSYILGECVKNIQKCASSENSM